MRHYDPHDHRLGYVTVCKPQNYTSPTASRQYDKFKVVAECLNLESVDLFNSQKFVARHHYPPEVCEFFWDSHNPGELLHNATQIRAPSGVATRIKGYSYKYRYNVQDSNGDFFPAPLMKIDDLKGIILRLDALDRLKSDRENRRKPTENFPLPDRNLIKRMLTLEETLVLNEQLTEPEACAIRFVKHRRLLERQKLIIMSQEKNDETELDLETKCIILGGTSRRNLFNLNFYRTYSGASKFLLGFDTFEEYIIHLNSFDPEVDTDLSRFKRLEGNKKLDTNNFEKITMTIMKFRRNTKCCGDARKNRLSQFREFSYEISHVG